MHLSVEASLRKLWEIELIDLNKASAKSKVSTPYPEEIIDAFQVMNEAERRIAFPFFDSLYYAAQLSPPPEDETNLLEHFLVFGAERSLAPHPLLQPAFMARNRQDLFGDGLGLQRFVEALAGDLSDPCCFLWLAWYRAAAGLESGEIALVHYLTRGADMNLAPNPYFKPDAYAAAAPDAPRNGVALVRHFLETGDRALTPAGERFDPVWYLAQHPEVAREEGGPLQYFLAVGLGLGHKPCGEEGASRRRLRLGEATSDTSPAETAALVLERWRRLHESVDKEERARVIAFKESAICPVTLSDPVAALRTLAFPREAEPDVDVLIPCYNEFEVTVECLMALHQAPPRRRLRVIVVDDASPDPRFRLFARVPGLVVLRNAENLHFLRSCNRAFAHTGAPYLFLLNNDAQPLAGAIDALVDALEQTPEAGAAAPMFLYPNGRLQEAGGTVRFDGESTMIGVGESPERPCYAYRRDVEYASGAGLMLRREALDGRLFDEIFAPAYCEDTDLCLRLRNDGWRLLYEPAARVVHHLSLSTNRASRRRRVQAVRKNQQKLMEKWGDRLRADNRARVLAFYLPQFHPFARNNIWWGRGFTEWTNVTRAVPSFEGHYQPHLPADLGFYDLRRVETMGEQQALAERYGVEGFIVYYYNFGAARVLEQPMEALLKRPDIPFRFALCWANENWTRHWDGGARAMLLEQQYDDATLGAVAADMIRFAADPRALRVQGKPLVMIYRPLLIPEIAHVAQRLRQSFRESGLGEIHLVYVESMEAIERKTKPADIGFDACVEFPPQGIAEPLKRAVAPAKSGWDGRLYDYAATARNAVLRESAPYPRYPAVAPSWDNTARQPLKGTTLVGAEPELFQAYVERKLDEMLDLNVGEHRLLFVNAWNEWAEGAHLEPDRAYGHRWLAALHNALLSRGVAP